MCTFPVTIFRNQNQLQLPTRACRRWTDTSHQIKCHRNVLFYLIYCSTRLTAAWASAQNSTSWFEWIRWIKKTNVCMRSIQQSNKTNLMFVYSIVWYFDDDCVCCRECLPIELLFRKCVCGVCFDETSDADDVMNAHFNRVPTHSRASFAWRINQSSADAGAATTRAHDRWTAAVAAATHRTHVFTVVPLLLRSRGPFECFVSFRFECSRFEFHVDCTCMNIVRSCSMFRIPIMPSRKQLFTHTAHSLWMYVFWTYVRCVTTSDDATFGRIAKHHRMEQREWWHTQYLNIFNCVCLCCVMHVRICWSLTRRLLCVWHVCFLYGCTFALCIFHRH